MPCCLFIQLPELLFPVQGTARGALEAVGLTITPSLSSPLPLTRSLSYELPLLCVLYKPSLNTHLLGGGGLQQNGGGVFFRQPSHGKRHLCTSVSPPFTHGQSPSVRPCCMCSLPGMHEPGFDFGPCPSCSKAGGQHPPFSSPKYLQSGQPQGSSQLHSFSHQYNLPGGNQLRAGSCWGQVKAAEGTLWVRAIGHALLALGEASNASSQPWQGHDGIALSPGGCCQGYFCPAKMQSPPG